MEKYFHLTNKIKFTGEEKEKLKKAMDLIIKDIDAIWDGVKEYATELKVLLLRAQYISDTTFRIIVNDEGIMLEEWLMLDERKIWIKRNQEPEPEKKSIFSRRTKKKTEEVIDYNLYYFLVANYKKVIRPGLLEEVEKIMLTKAEAQTLIDDIQKKYDKQASIELILATQNQQSIELTEEEGRTVGTIRLGSNVIKIVTNGDIVLKEPSPKQEIKKKVLYE